MTDIRTSWDGLLLFGDWSIDPPALASGANLETATLISLFSDARAATDDRLPGASDDRRGWWAGAVGSRLWLLTREKATNETRLRAEEYCREALNWMLTDGVADAIEVSAFFSGAPDVRRLSIDVGIYRDGAVLFARSFDWAWSEERRLARDPPSWRQLSGDA